jgi:hypothetical protein
MLCPYCGRDVKFVKVPTKTTYENSYECPHCKARAPNRYGKPEEYEKYPPVHLCAVGSREHGKTSYFAALFWFLFRRLDSSVWPKFFCGGIDATESDKQPNPYRQMADSFGAGELPDANPQIFPAPTFFRLDDMPGRPNCTLLCYDTAGEAFDSPAGIGQYAGYVFSARCVLMFFGLGGAEGDPADYMHRLLNRYTTTLHEKTKAQHLVVVYTKGDVLDLSGEYADLTDYLRRGERWGLEDMSAWLERRIRVSRRLEEYTDKVLRASHFVHMANKHFASVEYSLVSVLGAVPEKRDGNRLAVHATPKRVLDPLLWAIEKTLIPPPRRKLLGIL